MARIVDQIDGEKYLSLKMEVSEEEMRGPAYRLRVGNRLLNVMPVMGAKQEKGAAFLAIQNDGENYIGRQAELVV